MRRHIKRFVSGTILFTMICYTMPIKAFTNDETVYSKLYNNGERYETIISSKTNNNDEESIVQTETEKELPIDVKVSYKLDGKEISPEEILGKSGKVTITMKFVNKLENKVNVNGHTETMYTPFLIAAGTIIDTENNKNIKITNGKVMEQGDNVIVAGIAMPGLKESLKLPSDVDFDISDTIEISMETTNFEMNNIMTYATTSIFTEDININDKLDELYDSINELQDAANKLEDGSIKLKDGVVVLRDGAGELNNGVGSLVDGVNSLKEGTNKLNSGAKTLAAGTDEYTKNSQMFTDGIGQLSTGVSGAANGANQVNAGAAALKDGTSTLINGTGKLTSGADTLKGATEQVADGASKLADGAGTLSQGATDLSGAVGATATYTGNAQKDVEKIKGDIANISAKVDSLQASATIDVESVQEKISSSQGNLQQANATLSALLDQVEDENIKSQINSAIGSINQANGSIGEINPGSITVSSSIDKSSVNDAISSLNSSYNSLAINVGKADAYANGSSTAAKELAGGVSSLASSATDLKDGTSGIASGAKDLSSGISTLDKNVKENVVPGVEQLADGAAQVSNGLNQINEKTAYLADSSSKLTEASKQIKNGAAELSAGTTQLDSGVATLQDGTNRLKGGTQELYNGTNTLLNGTIELSDGMTKFNNEGVKKLTNKVNGDVKNVTNRIEKLQDLANQYDRFGSEEEREAIRFISIIDSIKNSSKDEADEEVITNDTKIEIKKDDKGE